MSALFKAVGMIVGILWVIWWFGQPMEMIYDPTALPFDQEVRWSQRHLN